MKINNIITAIAVLALCFPGAGNAQINVAGSKNTTGTASVQDNPENKTRPESMDNGGTQLSKQQTEALQSQPNSEDNRINAIQNRIETLEQMKLRVQSIEGIFAEQKEMIMAQIEAAIGTLNELKENSSETESAPVAASGKGAADEPFIYSSGVPQAFAIGALERIGIIADELETFSGKIESRIESVKSGGADINKIRIDLEAIRELAKEARLLAQQARDLVSNLGADEKYFNKNQENISQARGYVKSAMEKLFEGRQKANSILQSLKQPEAQN